jgi:hypothetical protein
MTGGEDQAQGAPHDPFIKLNHLFSVEGSHRSSALYVKPEAISEFYDGKIYTHGGQFCFVVSEKAAEIRALVLGKMKENRQAETLGK